MKGHRLATSFFDRHTSTIRVNFDIKDFSKLVTHLGDQNKKIWSSFTHTQTHMYYTKILLVFQ